MIYYRLSPSFFEPYLLLIAVLTRRIERVRSAAMMINGGSKDDLGRKNEREKLVQAGSRWKLLRRMSIAVFSIQTVKFCARLLCALAKTSPMFFLFCFFLPDFSSAKKNRRKWTTLAHFFSAKKIRNKTRVGPRDGHVTRVQNFRVYL